MSKVLRGIVRTRSNGITYSEDILGLNWNGRKNTCGCIVLIRIEKRKLKCLGIMMIMALKGEMWNNEERLSSTCLNPYKGAAVVHRS